MRDTSEADGLSVSMHPALYAALIGSSLALGLVAHNMSRPVTAALLFVLGVVLIAARLGLRRGLIASVLASLAYNLLSAPVLQLSFSSLDDLAPLLAFTVSAVASAYLAGRLKDEARASEDARRRIASLLKFSGHLQPAVDLPEMLRAAHAANPALQQLEVRLDDGRTFRPPLVNDRIDAAEEAAGISDLPGTASEALADRFDGGIVRCTTAKEHEADAVAYLAILAIAAERWRLTEKLVNADVYRKSEAFKTSLLSSMSHDLRTPLSVISASAGSLLRFGDQLTVDHKRDLLESIEQQSTRLNQLTSKLLSLGRIEGGLSASAMPEIDALEVLGAALVNIRQLAPTRTIRKALELDVAPVRADASLLEQVFQNVLENATVHTPPETPIYVSAYVQQATLVIAVEDRGAGVAEGDQEAIFERFHQGGGGTQRSGGTGLGLSIARGFARAIDGDVRLAPATEGKVGARFEICLPLSVKANG